MLNCRWVELAGGEYFLYIHKLEGVVREGPTGKIVTTLKEAEEFMIPPGGVSAVIG